MSIDIDWDEVRRQVEQRKEMVNNPSKKQEADTYVQEDEDQVTDEELNMDTEKLIKSREKRASKLKNRDDWEERLKALPKIELKDIPEQEKVASDILKTLEEKDAVILEAPTGWGKTGLAYQIYKQASKEGKSVLILNHSNVLLNQYIDLLERNIDTSISLMGKSNYKCYKNNHLTVDKAECGSKCIYSSDIFCKCEYYYRKRESQLRGLVISNYHQQFSTLNFDQNNHRRYDIVVCDECHNIERILVDYATVHIDYEIIKTIEDDILNTTKANKYTSSEASKLFSYINELKMEILDIDEHNYDEKFYSFYSIINGIKDILKQCNNNLIEYLKNLLSVYNIYKYGMFGGDNYLYEGDRDKSVYKLVPLYIGGSFKQYMYELGDKLVLMSATVINPKNMVNDLGLSENRTKYIELGSKIPKQNRPIYALSNCTINIKDPEYSKTADYDYLIESILKILDNHYKVGDSGFIYCNSYKLCKLIYEGIEGKTKFNILMNSSAKETKETLNQFLDTSKKHRLLISCSFAEGVNFNDDISRFQIIPKVPFLYLGSKRIKVKNEQNNEWYTNKTIEQIIQVAGRSVRSSTDYATTYILDNKFDWTYKKYKDDYPSWFNEAIIKLGGK